MKKLSVLILAINLAGCATQAVDPNATPAQVKAAQAQARFDQACSFLRGASSVATPLLPVITVKLGANGTLAIQAAQAAINQTCTKPLDVNNSAAVTQRVFDIAGEVIAVVVKAQAG